jgi:hypothetical protein
MLPIGQPPISQHPIDPPATTRSARPTGVEPTLPPATPAPTSAGNNSRGTDTDEGAAAFDTGQAFGAADGSANSTPGRPEVDDDTDGERFDVAKPFGMLAAHTGQTGHPAPIGQPGNPGQGSGAGNPTGPNPAPAVHQFGFRTGEHDLTGSSLSALRQLGDQIAVSIVASPGAARSVTITGYAHGSWGPNRDRTALNSGLSRARTTGQQLRAAVAGALARAGADPRLAVDLLDIDVRTQGRGPAGLTDDQLRAVQVTVAPPSSPDLRSPAFRASDQDRQAVTARYAPPGPQNVVMAVGGLSQLAAPLRTMNQTDLLALVGYTGNRFFMESNQALRQGTTTLGSQDYGPLIRAASSALNQLPVYRGRVVRVLDLSTSAELDQALARYVPGTVVQESSFVSTTAPGANTSYRPGNLLLEINSRSGRLVAGLSEKQDEHEVLFAPGARFVVESKGNATGPDGGRMRRIVLTELDSRHPDPFEVADASAWPAEARQADNKGSNAGGFRRSPDGPVVYVKHAPSEQHARNEVLAANLYKLAGIAVPDVRLVKLDGRFAVASTAVESDNSLLSQKIQDLAYRRRVHDGFAVDAWLANWDVVGTGFDNIISDPTGAPVRIDQGAALLFRAQGGKKSTTEFDGVVREWDTRTDDQVNSKTARMFSDIDPATLTSSARHIVELHPLQIDGAVDEAGFDEATATRLKNVLRARRLDIANKAGLSLPEEEAERIWDPRGGSSSRSGGRATQGGQNYAGPPATNQPAAGDQPATGPGKSESDGLAVFGTPDPTPAPGGDRPARSTAKRPADDPDLPPAKRSRPAGVEPGSAQDAVLTALHDLSTPAATGSHPGAQPDSREWTPTEHPDGHPIHWRGGYPEHSLDAIRFVSERFGDLRRLNSVPFNAGEPGYLVNCVNVATALAESWNGRPFRPAPATAPRSGSLIEHHFGTPVRRVSGPDDIVRRLVAAGPGAHGIVFQTRPDGTGHVLNVLHDPSDGSIVFLDAQSGRLADLPDGHSYGLLLLGRATPPGLSTTGPATAGPATAGPSTAGPSGPESAQPSHPVSVHPSTGPVTPAKGFGGSGSQSIAFTTESEGDGSTDSIADGPPGQPVTLPPAPRGAQIAFDQRGTALSQAAAGELDRVARDTAAAAVAIGRHGGGRVEVELTGFGNGSRLRGGGRDRAAVQTGRTRAAEAHTTLRDAIVRELASLQPTATDPVTVHDIDFWADSAGRGEATDTSVTRRRVDVAVTINPETAPTGRVARALRTIARTPSGDEFTRRTRPGDRMRLRQFLADRDRWRLSINPRDHADAEDDQRRGRDPARFYDRDNSPGFAEDLARGQREVLDGNGLEVGALNWHRYAALHQTVTRTSRGLLPAGTFDQVGVDGRQAGFYLHLDRPAPDIMDQRIGGRPLMADTEERDRRELMGEPAPLTVVTIDRRGGSRVATNYSADDVPALVDAVFRTFHAEIRNADSDVHRLVAIARLVRTLHVLHLFQDGNGRLNVFTLLPRLLMEYGFGPTLGSDADFRRRVVNEISALFNGGFSAEEIAVALWEGQYTGSADRPFSDPATGAAGANDPGAADPGAFDTGAAFGAASSSGSAIPLLNPPSAITQSSSTQIPAPHPPGETAHGALDATGDAALTNSLAAYLPGLRTRAQQNRATNAPVPDIVLEYHDGAAADAATPDHVRAAAQSLRIQLDRARVLTRAAVGYSRVITRRTATPGPPGRITVLESTPTPVIVGGTDPAAARIPKNLHFFWFGTKPIGPVERRNLTDWARRAQQSGWTMRVWVDDRAARANRDFLGGLAGLGVHQADVTPAMVDADPALDMSTEFGLANRHGVYNMAANVARYKVLHDYGGIHVDSDIGPAGVNLDNRPRIDAATPPFVAPLIRDSKSWFDSWQAMARAQGAGTGGPNWSAAVPTQADVANWRYQRGDFNNNLIVAPRNSAFLHDMLVDLKNRPIGSAEPIRRYLDLAGLPDQARKERIATAVRSSPEATGIDLFRHELAGRLRHPDQRGDDAALITIGTHVGAGRLAFDPGLVNRFAGLDWLTDAAEDQLDRRPVRVDFAAASKNLAGTDRSAIRTMISTVSGERAPDPADGNLAITALAGQLVARAAFLHANGSPRQVYVTLTGYGNGSLLSVDRTATATRTGQQRADRVRAALTAAVDRAVATIPDPTIRAAARNRIRIASDSGGRARAGATTDADRRQVEASVDVATPATRRPGRRGAGYPAQGGSSLSAQTFGSVMPAGSTSAQPTGADPDHLVDPNRTLPPPADPDRPNHKRTIDDLDDAHDDDPPAKHPRPAAITPDSAQAAVFTSITELTGRPTPTPAARPDDAAPWTPDPIRTGDRQVYWRGRFPEHSLDAVDLMRQRFGDLLTLNSVEFNVGEPGYLVNCVNAAVTAAESLSGRRLAPAPAAAPRPGTLVERYFGASAIDVADPNDIVERLVAAGPGAHGIVFMVRPDGSGHVVNAYHDPRDGSIVFLDAQSGRLADLVPGSRYAFLPVAPRPTGAVRPTSGRPHQPAHAAQSYGSAVTEDGGSSATHPRLRLSDVYPDERDWWRLYINPEDHAQAEQLYPDNPGQYYDRDRSEGFQENMVRVYRRVLNGSDVDVTDLDHESYTALHAEIIGSTTGRFDPLPDRQLVSFPIEGTGTMAADLDQEQFDGRRLMAGLMDTESQSLTRLLGNLIYRQHDAGQVQRAVDGMFTAYRADIASATTDDQRLRAIVRLVRNLHVLHPFRDGNGRLHVFLILPALLLRHGLRPPVTITDIGTLFNGSHSLDDIVDRLRPAVLPPSDAGRADPDNADPGNADPGNAGGDHADGDHGRPVRQGRQAQPSGQVPIAPARIGVEFGQGDTGTPTALGLGHLQGAARQVARYALDLQRTDRGRAVVTLTGYGNGSPARLQAGSHIQLMSRGQAATESGMRRAQAAENLLRSEVDRQLRDMQRGVPNPLTAADVIIQRHSAGRGGPEQTNRSRRRVTVDVAARPNPTPRAQVKSIDSPSQLRPGPLTEHDYGSPTGVDLRPHPIPPVPTADQATADLPTTHPPTGPTPPDPTPDRIAITMPKGSAGLADPDADRLATHAHRLAGEIAAVTAAGRRPVLHITGHADPAEDGHPTDPALAAERARTVGTALAGALREALTDHPGVTLADIGLRRRTAARTDLTAPAVTVELRTTPATENNPPTPAATHPADPTRPGNRPTTSPPNDPTTSPRWPAVRDATPGVLRRHVWSNPVRSLSGSPDDREPAETVSSSFDVRRFTVDGVAVTDLTVRIAAVPGEHQTLEGMWHRLRDGVRDYLNQPGYQLADGSRLNVSVELVGPDDDPHMVVGQARPGDPTRQYRWPEDAPPIDLAHEIGHQIGLRDEYRPPTPMRPGADPATSSSDQDTSDPDRSGVDSTPRVAMGEIGNPGPLRLPTPAPKGRAHVAGSLMGDLHRPPMIEHLTKGNLDTRHLALLSAVVGADGLGPDHGPASSVLGDGVTATPYAPPRGTIYIDGELVSGTDPIPVDQMHPALRRAINSMDPTRRPPHHGTCPELTTLSRHLNRRNPGGDWSDDRAHRHLRHHAVLQAHPGPDNTECASCEYLAGTLGFAWSYRSMPSTATPHRGGSSHRSSSRGPSPMPMDNHGLSLSGSGMSGMSGMSLPQGPDLWSTQQGFAHGMRPTPNPYPMSYGSRPPSRAPSPAPMDLATPPFARPGSSMGGVATNPYPSSPPNPWQGRPSTGISGPPSPFASFSAQSSPSGALSHHDPARRHVSHQTPRPPSRPVLRGPARIGLMKVIGAAKWATKKGATTQQGRGTDPVRVRYRRSYAQQRTQQTLRHVSTRLLDTIRFMEQRGGSGSPGEIEVQGMAVNQRLIFATNHNRSIDLLADALGMRAQPGGGSPAPTLEELLTTDLHQHGQAGSRSSAPQTAELQERSGRERRSVAGLINTYAGRRSGGLTGDILRQRSPVHVVDANDAATLRQLLTDPQHQGAVILLRHATGDSDVPERDGPVHAEQKLLIALQTASGAQPGSLGNVQVRGTKRPCAACWFALGHFQTTGYQLDFNPNVGNVFDDAFQSVGRFLPGVLDNDSYPAPTGDGSRVADAIRATLTSRAAPRTEAPRLDAVPGLPSGLEYRATGTSGDTSAATSSRSFTIDSIVGRPAPTGRGPRAGISGLETASDSDESVAPQRALPVSLQRLTERPPRLQPPPSQPPLRPFPAQSTSLPFPSHPPLRPPTPGLGGDVLMRDATPEAGGSGRSSAGGIAHARRYSLESSGPPLISGSSSVTSMTGSRLTSPWSSAAIPNQVTGTATRGRGGPLYRPSRGSSSVRGNPSGRGRGIPSSVAFPSTGSASATTSAPLFPSQQQPTPQTPPVWRRPPQLIQPPSTDRTQPPPPPRKRSNSLLDFLNPRRKKKK